jgi:hypothetical protein
MLFSKIDNPVFVFWAFFLQFVLITHFAVRKINLGVAIQYGWMVYSLSIVGLLVSIYQLSQGKNWIFWVGGIIFPIWATLGFGVEYVFDISWRTPINWRIFIPYVLLYLATIMFYWWPLGEINKVFWYVYAILFAISTLLNITSHTS